MGPGPAGWYESWKKERRSESPSQEGKDSAREAVATVERARARVRAGRLRARGHLDVKVSLVLYSWPKLRVPQCTRVLLVGYPAIDDVPCDVVKRNIFFVRYFVGRTKGCTYLIYMRLQSSDSTRPLSTRCKKKKKKIGVEITSHPCELTHQRHTRKIFHNRAMQSSTFFTSIRYSHL